MREWKFWDWVAYALLGTSVVTDALEQIEKRSVHFRDLIPNMDVGFIPLATFVLATVVFILRELGVLGKRRVNEHPGGDTVLLAPGSPPSAPTTLGTGPQPTVRLDEVIKRMTGRDSLAPTTDDDRDDVGYACDELIQKARNGVIAAFGGVNFRVTAPAEWDRMLRTPIPSDFWDTHTLDVDYLLDPQNEYRGMTMKRTGRRLDADERMGIWFDRKQIDELYPARNHGAIRFDRIALPEAAARIYGEAQRTGHWLAQVAEQLGGSDGPATENEILDYIANAAVMKHCAVYGRRPPSPHIVLIDAGDTSQYRFADGAKNLRDKNRARNPVVYTDLEIKRTDLAAMIADIPNW